METNKITLYSSCLMLYIAKADDIIDKKEMDIIKEILIDFFKINEDNANNIIKLSLKDLEQATDIFKYANLINKELSYKDKLDLVKCIFEVGYIDGKLHYLERHYIKTIASLLNLENQDIINANLEIKKYI
tara:strand:- start:33 stop:425 length:393 start_codon:yes stop_codon:yes gene_type:complete